MEAPKELIDLYNRAQEQLSKIRRRNFARDAIYSAPKMAELLGYTLVDKIHYEVEERIKNRKKPHVLLLFHRHGIKSTIFNYCDNVCRILQNPQTTGLIYSATHPIAKSMLEATSNLMKNNRNFLEAYGDIEGDIWNSDHIRVAGALGSIADNTYTVETGGVDKGMASKHFNWIKVDDIVNEDNYEHYNEREKVKKRFKALFNLQKRGFDKTGKWPSEMLVLGTRYHPDDLYEHIITEMADVFEIIVIGASRMVKGVEVPSLPKVYPNMEALEQVKVELGPYQYACQMEQNPHFKTNITLDYDKIEIIPREEEISMIQLIRANKIPQEQLALILDPADEIERGSNSSGLSLLRYDGKKLDILRVWKLKMLLDNLIKIVANVIKFYGIKYFYCEKSGLEGNVRYYLSRELSENGMANYVMQEAVSHGKESKNRRIMGLQPFINNGKIRRVKNYYHIHKADDKEKVDMFKMLEDEIRGFPDAGKDDLLDTLAYSLRREVFDLATNIIVPEIEFDRHRTKEQDLIEQRTDRPAERVKREQEEEDVIEL